MDYKDSTTSNDQSVAKQQSQLAHQKLSADADADSDEVTALTSFLVSKLGRKCFDDAVDFLSSISEQMEQQQREDDDEYLLDNAERILGADGLIYLDDLFLLITHITEASAR